MHERPSTSPHPRLRPPGGTPFTRGVAAAVLAVAALITAANAGPAKAAPQTAVSEVQHPQPGRP
ncbi:hypothetical protein C3489_02990 [Streptomyces sp. Ru71]|uniref:hypothetical protein n=1 Tax=Streptomyces sp. Ru71 TaxID=2080746 RepID=UPI000CDE22E7|nr:hypothetical protein [Streptomyces sp. Ru71]POX56771.1 hypothetical protein C3489_02990 [Streptomyces sp. Ru71]